MHEFRGIWSSFDEARAKTQADHSKARPCPPGRAFYAESVFVVAIEESKTRAPLTQNTRQKHRRTKVKHDRVLDRVLPSLGLKGLFQAKEKGIRFLEKESRKPRERMTNKTSKRLKSISNTIGAPEKLGEVSIDYQKQIFILHRMISASEADFSSLSMQ
ncbi:unnamed protein product [Linum trigynum]|uniref:Uncharacterized protein n=1 Tax=Linum trigynum TaxID=586398 RepID=A0AAV2DB83_9ROSI